MKISSLIKSNYKGGDINYLEYYRGKINILTSDIWGASTSLYRDSRYMIKKSCTFLPPLSCTFSAPFVGVSILPVIFSVTP